MDTLAIYNHSNTPTASKRTLQKVISDKEYLIYETVNFGILSSTISFCGVLTNVVNIAVFYRQGFDNTMNISFMGLAISDMLSLITMLLADVFMSQFLGNMGVSVASTEVQYLIGGLPHLCFSRITSWITVYITAERCLCITFPLRIKQLITKRRTVAIISLIYILIILSFEPEYETSYYGWKFDMKLNKSVIGLLFRSNRQNVEGVMFMVFGILGFVSFIAVIIFTLMLAIQLNKKTKWRKNANLEKLQAESISTRDRKTVKMVAMIATVLIVCYIPGVIVSMTTYCVPEFSVTGVYLNAYFMGWSFAVVFETFNSSINIFLYYSMSSKYKETFHGIFHCWKPNSS